MSEDLGKVFKFQVAEMIRHVIDSHNDPIPAVLEIPSKECPYDASKDSILRRAKVRYSMLLLRHVRGNDSARYRQS